MFSIKIEIMTIYRNANHHNCIKFLQLLFAKNQQRSAMKEITSKQELCKLGLAFRLYN